VLAVYIYKCIVVAKRIKELDSAVVESRKNFEIIDEQEK